MSTIDGIKKWGALGSLSVLDQFFFSGANFLISLLLARMLTVYEYGAYAFVISLFLLQFSLHNALIQEPVSVLGFKFLDSNRKQYAKILFGIHIIVCGLPSLAMIAYWLIAEPSSLTQSIAAYAFVNPLIFGFILMRRTSYTMLMPGTALSGSIAYFIASLGGLYFMSRSKLITPPAVFILMGIAGTLAMTVISIRTGFSDIKKEGASPLKLREVFKEHWDYGKWILANSTLGWCSYYLYMPILAIVIGLDAAGAFKAMENFILPLEQMITGLALILIPWVAEYTSSRPEQLKPITIRITLIMILLACVYVTVISVSGTWLASIVYHKDYYVSLVWLLPVLGISSICRAAGDAGIGTAVRCLKKPKYFFYSSLFAALISWTIGISMTISAGVPGAVYARSITAVANLLVLFILSLKLFSNRK